jgi:hypothetical protein
VSPRKQGDGVDTNTLEFGFDGETHIDAFIQIIQSVALPPASADVRSVLYERSKQQQKS